MKSFYRLMLTACILSFSFSELLGQEFQGIATYKTSSGVKITMDSTKISTEMIASFQAQLQKQMQKEFTLTFDRKSSNWKEVESLGGGPASANSGNMIVEVMVSGIGDGKKLLYKDLQDGTFEQSTDLMGKSFLIRDVLKKFSWQLTDETKQIGEFTCQKAIFSKIVDSKKFSTGMTEMEMSKDTLYVEAWYAPEIPVSHGPENYWGLPGLILELHDGNRVMICNKIILNPKEEISIERPNKGKVITQEEFQKLQEEKMMEMSKKYQGPSGGDRIEIKIGN